MFLYLLFRISFNYCIPFHSQISLTFFKELSSPSSLLLIITAIRQVYYWDLMPKYSNCLGKLPPRATPISNKTWDYTITLLSNTMWRNYGLCWLLWSLEDLPCHYLLSLLNLGAEVSNFLASSCSRKGSFSENFRSLLIDTIR
jgi:hypothetical protein